jgi:coproporphyrinogen III oxidase-like Fe-S oxidoreductase
LSEFSIELNPFPFDEIINFIANLNKQFKQLKRIRYSFGIQSFDDKILTQIGRPYDFLFIQKFFKSLEKLKEANNVFNFDFIAFGKFNSNNCLWDQNKLNFFKKFLISKLPDSISLYTLEVSEKMKNYDFY